MDFCDYVVAEVNGAPTTWMAAVNNAGKGPAHLECMFYQGRQDEGGNKYVICQVVVSAVKKNGAG